MQQSRDFKNDLRLLRRAPYEAVPVEGRLSDPEVERLIQLYGMLYLEECRVPRDQILLDADGFRKMLAVFNVERLGNASRSLALGQAAFDRAVTYAKERQRQT